jgi:hypothetical protein
MKKKLRLQIEKLRVEQFEVQSHSPVARGTVHGFDSYWHSWNDEDSCNCELFPETQVFRFTECCP